MVIALKGDFDLLLCLTQVGISANSIESEICPKGLPKEIECQDRCQSFKSFKGASTQ